MNYYRSKKKYFLLQPFNIKKEIMKMPKPRSKDIPFVNTDKLTIYARWDEKLNGQFKVTVKGKPEKIFSVKGNPLAIFKKVEKYVGKIA